MTRKGVWNIQQVRDKYLQELWVNTNELMIWGSNASGALGVNAPSDVKYSSPIQVPGTNWAQVSGSYSSWWATKTDGTLWSWGGNDDGQLGHNERSPSGYSSPVQIGSNTNWSSVRAGLKMCFFRTTGNALFAVGQNTNGQLGNNSIDKISSPVLIGTGAWSDVGGGYYTSFGIREW